MSSALQDQADLVPQLRQQLILAQVRIMELEDMRDELAPQLAESRKLLAAAQTLADAKLDEAAHLEKVRADLQAHYEHLRHMQHVTHEALTDTRARLVTCEQTLAAEQQTTATLTATRHGLEARLEESLAGLAHSRALAEQRAGRIGELDAELRAMKGSRSWRWTGWLRSLERAFRRRSA